MKILFISKANAPDYQCDMVLHGGRSALGANFIDMNKAWYMYKGREQDRSRIYGKGFTVYGHLEDIEIDRSNILEKIQDKYFDYIIYGSCNRDLTYLAEVQLVYPKEKIIFIDGEDEQNLNTDLINKGIYFKRELVSLMPNAHPINFSIPEHLVINKVTEKEKLISDIIPNSNRNYIYNNQEDYYKEYQKSFFAVTTKKAGWDCLRHYEILMSGCIPLFTDINNCPDYTMYNFPKSIISGTNSVYGHVSDATYLDLCEALLEYTRENLTTKKMFNQILNFLN